MRGDLGGGVLDQAVEQHGADDRKGRVPAWPRPGAVAVPERVSTRRAGSTQLWRAATLCDELRDGVHETRPRGPVEQRAAVQALETRRRQASPYRSKEVLMRTTGRVRIAGSGMGPCV